MRRVIVLGLIGLLAITGSLIWRERVTAMSFQLSLKDSPEHGIQVTLPTDPGFDEKFLRFVKNQPKDVLECIRPLSAIVHNRSKRVIVGIRLQWEVLKPDGSVLKIPVGSFNPAAFMYLGRPEFLRKLGASVILPGHSVLLSTGGSATEDQDLQMDLAVLSFHGSQEDSARFRAELSRGNQLEAFKLSQKSTTGLLRDASAVTVSVDGVLFEDGTFIGDDQTGLFSEARAYFDAERDLAKEVNDQSKRKTPSEVFTYVQQLTVPLSGTETLDGVRNDTVTDSSAAGTPNSDPRFATLYRFWKATHAQHLLAIKEKVGAKEAVEREARLATTPNIQLRKTEVTNPRRIKEQ